MRTVEDMAKFFDSIRASGLRRGPRRLIAGIGGGVAEKLGINVWVARLLILVSFLLPVLGIGAYLVVWILTPWQDGRIPLERVFGSRRNLRR
jgi:phage shock protein PspC (stress-responsive transcriptional regulator)